MRSPRTVALALQLLVSDAIARLDAVRALIASEPPADGVGGVDGPGSLRRLCRAAVRALPASGAAIILVAENGIRGLAAATDPLSAELAELQYTIGEGPSFEAYASRRPVLTPDLSDGAMAQWPGYAPAAQERGVGAVFAFPLHLGAARLGVLDLYRHQPGSLTDDSLALALTFAEIAVQILLDRQERAPDGHLGDGLDLARDSGVVLYQAQGMTMIDLGVSIGDAMARLRAYAYASGRALQDVARDVVDGRLRLERDDP